MKASLKKYRQSPGKVRLAAGPLRGKTVHEALDILQVMDKKAAGPLRKLIVSAANNARQAGETPENLSVSRIVVNQGPATRRYRPRAFGRSTMMKRRTSAIHVDLR